MIRVTGHAQQTAWRERTFPPVEQVRPGLWSIPVPIPDNPLRYVLVYVFELSEGIAIVDAGWPVQEAWDALTAGLASIGCRVADIRAVLVTHVHADHYGLAPRIREASGAWIGVHEAELSLLARRDTREIADSSRRWLLSLGAPAPDAAAIAGEPEDYEVFQFPGAADRLIADGDRLLLPEWDVRAVWTPGHTPGHLCFHVPYQGLFLSGDHVLPRISPNIALQRDSAGSPLDDFVGSLRRVSELDVAEVLPAHEYRFSGLKDRALGLVAHHAARFAEIEDVLRAMPGATAWETASSLTWSRPWGQILGPMRRAALGETQAHLVSLERAGRAKQVADARTVRWFSVAS
jgi:glyoxylase-like metal-dependent hydrolase (beta-lactamase superfamily II)